MQKQTKITTPLIQTKTPHQNPNYTNTQTQIHDNDHSRNNKQHQQNAKNDMHY